MRSLSGSVPRVDRSVDAGVDRPGDADHRPLFLSLKSLGQRQIKRDALQESPSQCLSGLKVDGGS